MSDMPPRSSEFFRAIKNKDVKEWTREAILWAFKLECELAAKDMELAAKNRELDALREAHAVAVEAENKYEMWTTQMYKIKDNYGRDSEEMKEFDALWERWDRAVRHIREVKNNG